MAGKRERSESEWTDATLTTLPDGVIACEIVPRLDIRSVCALAGACKRFWTLRSDWADAWIDAKMRAVVRFDRDRKWKDFRRHGTILSRNAFNALWHDIREASQRVTAEWFFSRAAIVVEHCLAGYVNCNSRRKSSGDAYTICDLPLIWFVALGRASVVRDLLAHCVPDTIEVKEVGQGYDPVYYDAPNQAIGLAVWTAIEHDRLEVLDALIPHANFDDCRYFTRSGNVDDFSGILRLANSRRSTDAMKKLLPHMKRPDIAEALRYTDSSDEEMLELLMREWLAKKAIADDVFPEVSKLDTPD